MEFKNYTGETSTDSTQLKHFSRNTSIFERTPSVITYPKDTAEVVALVKDIHTAKEAGEDVSITGRAAGTDMSGGPLTTSVVASFTKHMNHVIEVGDSLN